MAKCRKVLIVDDEPSVRRLLSAVILKEGYEVCTAENGQEAVEKVDAVLPDVIFMDVRMPVMDGMEAFEIIRQKHPEIAVVLLTAFGSVDLAVETMKKGAFDYLVKPSNVAEVRRVLERADKMLTLKEEADAYVQKPNIEVDTNCRVIGKSAIFQEVFKTVGKVAETMATVLITGESGSGKEVIAKMIYANSLRRNGPFIKVNCGAIPENLLESELFGYERGAFTGAFNRKPGRFELANNGTIFLDEVGELPLHMQVKLLRVLQEREFERVGGIDTIHTDVRVIAATNQKLEELIGKGSFREDLYYRLNVVRIHVPPLRERVEDIPLFVETFVQRFAQEFQREVPFITPEAMQILLTYRWPGNVRELANILERAVIMANGIIGMQELEGLTINQENVQSDVSTNEPLRDILRQVEKQTIGRALKKHNGNKVHTAQALGISRSALLYKIEEYGLGKEADDLNRIC